jgi:RNA polymerase sigma-70 factor (ECF subfamily)
MADTKTSNHELFLQLFVRHERAMRAYARTLLPSWQDVDEAIQESSLVAWRKFEDFDPATNFAAWLATIVRFEALRLRRARHRNRLIFSDELLQLLENEGAEDYDRLERQRSALEKCLSQLQETQRQILALAYNSDLKLHQVAEKSGHSTEGFYKLIQRLRAALLKCAQRELAREVER